MSFLYRVALTVTRKQPYIDWANATDDEAAEHVSHLDQDRRTVYLVPSADYAMPIAEALAEFWEDIFEEELAAWSVDEGAWPAARTRDLFDAWFDAEVTDAVFDLTPDEALNEREVELADLSYVLHHCAWCDLELEPNEGRSVGFKLANRELFAGREGLTMPLSVNEERVVTGVFMAPDSPDAAAGDDFVFRACASHCDKMLRKQVPRALQRLPV